MTTDTLARPTELPESECAWPPSLLDREPEVCHCLPHGHELPCVARGSRLPVSGAVQP